MANETVLKANLPGLRRLASGKVREVYEIDGGLLLVATDRLSAFDVIMRQGVAGRGRVLTELSAFWFERLEAICPNHLITTDLAAMPAAIRPHADLLEGRTMYVERLEIVPVECVVRGYLAGGGWKEYRETGACCGVALPAGLTESEKLPEPIFTPTTKADQGHALPMTFQEVAAEVGADRAEQLRATAIRLYQAGADYAAQRGILLADTKFEFGLKDGALVLADEVLTPDSSRYWDKETYAPGRSQDSFDKQIVRDWLEHSDWNKQPPPPNIPETILEKIARRYREIADRLMT